MNGSTNRWMLGGKLVELIKEGIRKGLRAKGDDRLDYSFEDVADYLISNGVTVQEHGYWASLTDCANAGVYCSVCHKKIYKEDYARCNRKNKLRSDYCPHCGSKMMPQPPKGE